MAGAVFSTAASTVIATASNAVGKDCRKNFIIVGKILVKYLGGRIDNTIREGLWEVLVCYE